MANKNHAVDTNVDPGGDSAVTFKSAHNGHPLTHVGQVVNASRPQIASDPRGGVPATFDVWYCQLDHVLIIDNT